MILIAIAATLALAAAVGVAVIDFRRNGEAILAVGAFVLACVGGAVFIIAVAFLASLWAEVLA